MPAFTRDDALRIAALARVALAPDDAARLAPVLSAITDEFAALADVASRLPPPDDAAAGPLRADEPRPASEDEVAGILRAAPTLDRSGSVQAPRGPS